MIGAIIGDIVGSIYEFNNHRSKDFELFGKSCFATDDSIMTIAIGKAFLECKADFSDLGEKAIDCMQELGRPYPNCGFGGSFYKWIYSDNPKPYNSYGNGAAMRISAVGWVAKDIEQVKQLSKIVTEVSHNHPEGIKGAEATAVAIFLARQGKSKEEIRKHMLEHYYKLDFSIDEIRPTYKFNETCQDTVPEAIQAFLEGEDFEDCIRTAVSVGGDSDTLACITGSIAEAFYGVPDEIRQTTYAYLNENLLHDLYLFEVMQS